MSRPIRKDVSEADSWALWSARVYAKPGWPNTVARYWRSRWTLARCLWCRSRRNLQLNHLTYIFARRWWGYTPLWTLVPLCSRCHHLETRWTRRVRRVLPWGEHAWVTFGVYLIIRGVLLGAVYAGWRVAGLPSPL